MNNRFGIGAMLLAAAAVLGCSSKDAPTVEQRRTDWDAKKASSAAAEKMRGIESFVSAVSSGKPGAPVGIKFDITAKPQAGTPLDIVIGIAAQSESIASLEVYFKASDGLQVLAGAQSARLEKPQPGSPVMHTVRVLAPRDGMYFLSAVALVEGAGDGASLARTFSIPIIVGTGASAASQKATPVVTDAKGERLAPLSATETTAPK